MYPIIQTKSCKFTPTKGGINISVSCIRPLHRRKEPKSKEFLLSIFVPDNVNDIPNLEVYSGQNYIPSSDQRSYSDLYPFEKIPHCWRGIYSYLVSRANGALAKKIVLL